MENSEIYIAWLHPSDLAYGHELKNSIEIIDAIDVELFVFNKSDINNVLKTYNVCRYITADAQPSIWDETTAEAYHKKARRIVSMIAKFFKGLSDNSIEGIVTDVIPEYREVFWQLFEKYQCYVKISEVVFCKVVDSNILHLRSILNNKKTSKNYSRSLRLYLLKSIECAEWIVADIETCSENNENPFHLSEILQIEDFEEIFLKYINSEEPNYNYLYIIAFGLKRSGFILTKKTRFAAYKRAQHKEEESVATGLSFNYGGNIRFVNGLNEEFIIDESSPIFKARYSWQWLRDNRDYPTLLNNFIYLFQYVDLHMCCCLVSKKSYFTVLEIAFSHLSNSSYFFGVVFKQLNLISTAQMNVYYDSLNELGIRLENVIEWFFCDYLCLEFGVQGMHVVLPSKESTILEKCTSIMPAMEYVIKQYSHYCEDGYIDEEYVQFQSDPLIFKIVPSLQEKKYVYTEKGDSLKIQNILFSKYSFFASHGKYKTFYDYLMSEEASYDNLHNFQKNGVEWLKNNNILCVSEERNISFCNQKMVDLLRELYDHEVLVYNHFSSEDRECLDDMERNGFVIIESTLLSRLEADYFDYCLNRRSFYNGLDLITYNKMRKLKTG